MNRTYSKVQKKQNRLPFQFLVFILQFIILNFQFSIAQDYRDILPVPDVQPDGTLLEELNYADKSAWLFSFVQISDLHIGEGYDDYGMPGYDDDPPQGDIGYSAKRLRTAVNWINNNSEEYKIAFVIVNGDITDSAEKSEFLKAKEILDNLRVPYIPTIGNHDIWPYTKTSESEIPNGDVYFREVFNQQFIKLRSIFTNLYKEKWYDGTRDTPIWNGECDSLSGADTGCYTYFQNYAFDFKGYHFIILDFNTRNHAIPQFRGIGPDADLFDSDKVQGTFPWFKEHLTNYPFKGDNNIFLFAHHPLTRLSLFSDIASFTESEYETITEFLDDYRDNIGLWASGHLHFNRVYNVGDMDGTDFIYISPVHETGALKEPPKNVSFKVKGNIVNTLFNSKIFRVWNKSDDVSHQATPMKIDYGTTNTVLAGVITVVVVWLVSLKLRKRK